MSSNNFRIMKAISLEMYKRMLEGCKVNDSSIASSSANTSTLLNPYGSTSVIPQVGSGTSKAANGSSALKELNELPPNLLESRSTDEDPKITQTLLRSIPDSQRNRARNLINTILLHPEFSWDDAGVIKFNNVVHQKSNIVDLISVATRTTKIRKLKIPGLSVFIRFLKSINIPRHYLGSHFSTLMDEVEDASDSSSPNFKSNEPQCSSWITYEEVNSD